MSQRLVGAATLTPSGWEDGAVTLDGGGIAAIGGDAAPGARETRLDGLRLIPGLIDLHGDAIEKEVEPRPGALLPLSVALHAADRRYAASGVTTAYHALSFATGEFGVRSPGRAAELAEAIHRFNAISLVNHRVHVRYEVTDPDSEDVVAALVRNGVASLLSFMDHTPGQGQFKTAADYSAYVRKRNGTNARDVADLLDLKAKNAPSAHTRIKRLAQLAQQCGVPIASHDDDDVKRVALMADLGAKISEFPMTMETAKGAHHAGLKVCVGAPNALRGVSQSGGLSACAAIEAGVVSCLVSDYAPQTLLPAAATLNTARQDTARQASQGQATGFGLVTAGPADAVGLDRHGRIRVGDVADVIAIAGDAEATRCVAVWRHGELVWRSGAAGD